jgi:hypothetical protein
MLTCNISQTVRRLLKRKERKNVENVTTGQKRLHQSACQNESDAKLKQHSAYLRDTEAASVILTEINVANAQGEVNEFWHPTTDNSVLPTDKQA